MIALLCIKLQFLYTLSIIVWLIYLGNYLLYNSTVFIQSNKQTLQLPSAYTSCYMIMNIKYGTIIQLSILYMYSCTCTYNLLPYMEVKYDHVRQQFVLVAYKPGKGCDLRQ